MPFFLPPTGFTCAILTCVASLGFIPPSAKTRKVLLNISLQCNLRPAGTSDQLDDTLNYEHIEAEAIAIAKKGKFFLVETLAERIATACLRHAAVHAVRVIVDKPSALPHTRSVAIEIERHRE